MSIAQQNEVEALKKRVETLEQMVKQLYADVHTPKSSMLTLPEKRKLG